MAKGFDTLHIKSAVKSHNKFDLSMSHLTTMEIGQIVPLYCNELVPGDKFNIKASYFSRMAPLVRPTYGDFSFKTVYGFVPYHQLAFDAEAWLAGKTSFEGVTPKNRYLLMSSLTLYILVPANGVTSAGTSADYDLSYIAGSGSITYRKWTNFGRFVYKILTSLGYNMPQNLDAQTSSDYMLSVGSWKLSAYPLLAFAKLYNDYMSQSQRFNTSALSNFLRCVKYNITVTGYSNGALDDAGLKIIFDNIKLCYENDYFTSAWQNPNSALYAPESIGSMTVPVSSADLLGNNTNNVGVTTQVGMVSVSDHRVTLAQRSLDFLKSFDDWVRRNNYAGSRPVQQVYSRFGIKTDDYRSHYAHILDTDSMDIQVGDVTAMADTTGAILGDYAGKGIVSGNKGISFASSDYGMLFIVGFITVRPMNAYGFDRSVLKQSPLDYYNPEFDGLGANAISYGELFTDPMNQEASDTTLDNVVYGFTERYNEYRFGRDKITGDFRSTKNLNPENTWHTGRLLTKVRAAGQMIAQSSAMNTLAQTNSEYNRIFSDTSGDMDHFYMTCRFQVEAIRPMLSLNQVPRLGEGDTVVSRNGNEIS